MKHIIIGTAGHIDHGKTTLIKALTGRNTDRWEEEQRRGITIDLGFTYFDLPSGNRVGIVDVPGHERFINNMTAGVVGMDLVLLVIAADEGIMPQTREHMDILGLLGIEKSIIVLNKCDLVDEDWIELVEEDIKEELEGTFLENSPMLRVSSHTGEGLDKLVSVIDQMTMEDVVEKDVNTIPRLPIDRVFSLSGFGTIITGTLCSGKIRREDDLELFPLGRECRVRSIQVHGESVEECYAGQRVALNLSNVKKKEIQRGCVLAPVGSMKNTDLLDVKLNVLDSSLRVLQNHQRLHLFTGTTEVLCRAVLLDKKEIGPGESGYVQLRLEEEIAVRKGDRFVVRFYSPLETIGGGVVIEANPVPHRKFKDNVIDELKRKEEGSSAEILDIRIKEKGNNLVTAKELAKLTALSDEEVAEAIEELKAEGRVDVIEMRKDTWLWHVSAKNEAKELVIDTLSKYEKEHPYRYGMKKAEIQTLLFKGVKPNVFDQMIEIWVAEGEMNRQDEFLSTKDFEVLKDDVYRKVRTKFLKTFDKAKYDFVRYSEIEVNLTDADTVFDILNILLAEEEVVKVDGEMFTLKRYMDDAVMKVKEQLEKDPLITIAQVRDLFDTSRKSAKPILEYMDRMKVTKKTGAESERMAF